MASAGQLGSSPHPREQPWHEPGVGQTSPPESSTVGNIVNTVTEKVQDMASEAKETVGEWGSAAADAASQAKHKAQDLAMNAAHTAESFGEELTHMIRRYPVPSLLVGFGVGYLLARVLHR
jgi:hypothetical protein